MWRVPHVWDSTLAEGEDQDDDLQRRGGGGVRDKGPLECLSLSASRRGFDDQVRERRGRRVGGLELDVVLLFSPVAVMGK